VGKDIFLKRYEKTALIRFFALFFGAFMLMFLLLSTLYYFQESSRLTKELEISSKMNYIECMRLEMDECSEEKSIKINLNIIHKDILYAFFLVLFIFIPISLGLSLFSIKPVRQASIMIDNFIANIVHDINTPIATIMLNAKSLLKREKNEPKKLNRILSSSQQLSDMQHDLLALADEKDEVIFEKVKILSTIIDIIESFKIQYPTQNFELHLQEQSITLNPVDFKRIVQNLISNAIKYNRHENSIKIQILPMQLIIEDKGKGILNPKKVFNRNYRENYTIQGNGLGLASVLSMCKRNHIKIDIESQLNIGTRIILNFC